jgi:hypothetical protein
MLVRLRDRLLVLAGGLSLLIGTYVAPDLAPALTAPALVLGGLLTLWGAVELMAAPARGVWSKARARRIGPAS